MTLAREDAMYPSERADKFMVRLPDGMRGRLKEEAAASGRSMNNEIVHRLAGSFEAPVALTPAIAKLIEEHIQQEVQARLLRVASQLGGGK